MFSFYNVIAGGRQGKVPVASFETLDFREGKWTKLPDIPSKRVFALYTHSDQQLFSVGGLLQDAKAGFSNALEIFDVRNGNDVNSFWPISYSKANFL